MEMDWKIVGSPRISLCLPSEVMTTRNDSQRFATERTEQSRRTTYGTSCGIVLKWVVDAAATGQYSSTNGAISEPLHMSWESRRGRGRYYTRSRCVNGRIVREYIGTGSLANLLARLDLVHRRQMADVAAACRRQKAEIEDVNSRLAAFGQHVDLITEAVLTAAGYHRHCRGSWRKRRGIRNPSS